MARSLLALLLLYSAAQAQVQVPTINRSAAAAYAALLRLRNTATVLHTTAHPDDEDGALLTWLARGQGVRTGLFTLTRGEGGADLTGPELFDALGLIRTEELLAAGRYYGVDQFFSRAADFGFSKRLDETLERWGHENVLRDCVRVVRLYRPDVIVSRFHGAARDGHGNHQAAGALSAEVIKAAADPNFFPEQFREGLRPWQVKKLYRSVRDDEPATLRIETGVFDPLLGASYRQIAGTGLSLQRSQGAGARRPDPGPARSSLQLVEFAAAEKPAIEGSLFDGLDTTLRGLARLAPSLNLDAPLGEVEKEVAHAIDGFDARDPSRVLEQHVAPALRSLRAIIQNVTESQIEEGAKYELLFRLRNKSDEFVNAGNLLAGVSFEVLADANGVAIPGQKFGVTATLVNRSRVKFEEVELGLNVRGALEVSSTPARTDGLLYNEVVKQQFQVSVMKDDTDFTRPYWSRKDPYRDTLFQADKPQYQNLPYEPAEVIGNASYRIAGVRFTISQPAMTSAVEPPMGEQRHVLMIAPAVSVQVSPRAGILAIARRGSSANVRAEVLSNISGDAEVKVSLELPPGWTAQPPEIPLRFTHAGEVQTADFKLVVPASALTAGKKYSVRIVAESGGQKYREGYQTIARRDLETRRLYAPATAEFTAVDVRVPQGLKVAYVMGAGDDVPAALEQLGIKAQMLSPGDLATGNLAAFDTIVVGIRAMTVRPDVRTYNSRLLEFARNGGNLVIQYQDSGLEGLQMARRPEEVVEEDAKVTVLDAANPIFNTPNAITTADFDGWVEERGSHFMSQWEAQFKPLVESHDQGQDPQRGGLLTARYGKGSLTYCAYSLYRQLPAGVPGAYRLLANLVSPGRR